MVGEKGLEPSQLALLVPKSNAPFFYRFFTTFLFSIVQHFVNNATYCATIFKYYHIKMELVDALDLTSRLSTKTKKINGIGRRARLGILFVYQNQKIFVACNVALKKKCCIRLSTCAYKKPHS